MSWDSDLCRGISIPFYANDVPEFTRMLHAHPKYRTKDDGSDQWMWSAAMDGNLPMVQALVDLGVDVNISKDAPDSEDPFNTVEGPILFAAGEGHLEVVRWLLDRGAKINYTVQGKTRCLPLLRAAADGHLDVVKLLVERGADVPVMWNGFDAVRQAEDFGHPEVAAYLRSVVEPKDAN